MSNDKDDSPKVSEKSDHVNADDTANAAVTLFDKQTTEECDQHKCKVVTEIEPKENAGDGTLVNATEIPHLGNQTENCEKIQLVAADEVLCGKYHCFMLKMLEKFSVL